MIRFSTAAATAAAITTAATPAVAVELPVVNNSPVQVLNGAPHDAANYRYGRRRHRGGVDAGDVIAGVLVIGAIAAIAGSSNSRNRNRGRDEERDTRNDSRRNDSRDYQQSSGIDRAVDMCVDQVERGNDQVDSVDNASRTSDGWRVSGSLEQGSGWDCWIDNDGRIREVNLGDRYSQNNNTVRYDYASAGGEQLSDDAYARARAAIRDEGYSYASSNEAYDNDLESGAVPAYPGGPLPGEEGYTEAMGG